MDRDDIVGPLICFVMVVLSGICGCNMGADAMLRHHQQEAIKAGVAEWVADKNGTAVFKWKEKE